MSRLLILLSAFLSFFIVSSPAMAEDDIIVTKVVVSDLAETDGVTGRVFIGFANGQIYDVTMTGCAIQWKGGEPFYMIGVRNTGVVLIPVRIMDAHMSVTGNNFAQATKRAIDAKQMCVVTKLDLAD